MCSVLFLRWLVRGMSTSLCATPRLSSPWPSLTTRGPTWRSTRTACRGWTTTLCPSPTTTTLLRTCWMPGSSVWRACPFQMATATSETQGPAAQHTCTHKHSQSLLTPTLKIQSWNCWAAWTENLALRSLVVLSPAPWKTFRKLC